MNMDFGKHTGCHLGTTTAQYPSHVPTTSSSDSHTERCRHLLKPTMFLCCLILQALQACTKDSTSNRYVDTSASRGYALTSSQAVRIMLQPVQVLEFVLIGPSLSHLV
mmetsp:Transcript_18214/g.34100  ORF Transcript_18214/g.34100 Transcript_18214/m.34100 type:complete len:108 (+) Transcript_18214:1040-1363(+)